MAICFAFSEAFTFDVQNEIFKYASDFTTPDTDDGKDNAHRFAEINGVKLALPMIGDGSNFIDSDDFRAGTAVDNAPVGEINSTYDDLLAIWDAYSGSGTSIGSNGTPVGWQYPGYGSATLSTSGHAYLLGGDGYVHRDFDPFENDGLYAAVQVL
jgi:hypothetical protein